MNAWLRHSPFLAVGIYISGDSRGCRNQPNLTRHWVAHPAAQGLAAAADHPRPAGLLQPAFPEVRQRRDDQPDAGSANGYSRGPRPGTRRGRQGGRAAARALGIVGAAARSGTTSRASTTPSSRCRESALAFLSGWTVQLHRRATSPASTPAPASGIKMLDDARVNRPGDVQPPRPDLDRPLGRHGQHQPSYIRDDGWRPGGRVKQYQGGHNETWGGVTINIDRNYLDVAGLVGHGRRPHCDGIARRASASTGDRAARRVETRRVVKALQCLLQEQRPVRRPAPRPVQRAAAAADPAPGAEQRGFAVSGNWGRPALDHRC